MVVSKKTKLVVDISRIDWSALKYICIINTILCNTNTYVCTLIVNAEFLILFSYEDLLSLESNKEDKINFSFRLFLEGRML